MCIQAPGNSIPIAAISRGVPAALRRSIFVGWAQPGFVLVSSREGIQRRLMFPPRPEPPAMRTRRFGVGHATRVGTHREHILAGRGHDPRFADVEGHELRDVRLHCLHCLPPRGNRVGNEVVAARLPPYHTARTWLVLCWRRSVAQPVDLQISVRLAARSRAIRRSGFLDS